MTIKVNNITKSQLKTNLPDIRPGDLVSVHQKIPILTKASASGSLKSTSSQTQTGKKKESKKRAQVFEGIVIARKHGKGITATITVRKEVRGIGCEKTFPLHSPTIEKIEIIERHKVRRAKLYYLRKLKGKKARLKRKEEKTTK